MAKREIVKLAKCDSLPTCMQYFSSRQHYESNYCSYKVLPTTIK